MQIFKKITLAITLPLLFMFIAAPALARVDPGPGPGPGPSPSPQTVASSTKTAIQCGVNSAASGDCNQQPTTTVNGTITNVVNLLSELVGVLSVIMIIVGGLRYVTAAGNAERAKSARTTIIYAILGLVVVALAQIIVKFVLNKATS